ncbi:MAG: aldehyde dehydrogenase family protein, partial [Planctomycetota bacterium]
MTTLASDARTIRDLDPATGDLIAEIPCATTEEVQRAVARARAAAAGWAATPIEERAAALNLFGEALGADADALGLLATREMGKTLRTSVGEVRGYATGVAAKTAEIVGSLAPITYDIEGQTVRTVRDPHGVVAAITPWNFPVGMPLTILVPALAAG